MKLFFILSMLICSLHSNAAPARVHVKPFLTPDTKNSGNIPNWEKDNCISAICHIRPNTSQNPNILDYINKKKGLSSLDYTGPCTPGKGCRPRQVCPRDPQLPCDPPVCEPDPQCT